jgi:uncharacterized membrane protein (UPF0182 family)
MSMRRLAFGVVAIAAILLGGRGLSLLYDSFTWYDALGARSLWMERAMDASLVYSSGFIVAFAFALANFVVVRRGIGGLTRPRRLANVEFGEAVPAWQLNVAGVTISAGVAISLLQLLPSWRSVALIRLGVDFREADPYLHHDLSFYVAWLPLERALYSWALALVVAVSVLALAAYVFASGIRWTGGVLEMTSRVRRHLGILAAILLLVCAWSYRLDSYALLSGGNHDGAGFGYVDHQWMLSGLLALSLATAATALTVAVSAWMGQLRTSLIAIIVAIGLAGFVEEILPFVYYRSTSAETARAENVAYSATKADFTRRAFGTEVEEGADGSSPFASLSPVSPLSSVRDTLVAPGATGTRIVDEPTVDIAAPSLGNGLSRLAHAWAARNFGLLSDSVRRRARIVAIRDVRERIGMLYPFFYVGRSLRPLYKADTLFWTAALYTSSADYPLAERREISGETRSYFHRSGTAIVNARTGRVFAAIDLPPEPVAAGWIRSFEPAGALEAAQSLQHSLSMNTTGIAGGEAGGSDTTFRARVVHLYDRMRTALSAGDLRGFGLAYDSLGALVGSTHK